MRKMSGITGDDDEHPASKSAVTALVNVLESRKNGTYRVI